MAAIIDQIWSNIYNEASTYKSETNENQNSTPTAESPIANQPDFKIPIQPNHH